MWFPTIDQARPVLDQVDLELGMVVPAAYGP